MIPLEVVRVQIPTVTVKSVIYYNMSSNVNETFDVQWSLLVASAFRRLPDLTSGHLLLLALFINLLDHEIGDTSLSIMRFDASTICCSNLTPVLTMAGGLWDSKDCCTKQ